MIYIGLDMSLTSPGIVINDNGKWNFYFFVQRKREEGIDESSDNWTIRSIPYISEWKTREERIDYVTNNIMILINSYMGKKSIGIENYAFGASSSSVTGLAELGGVMRHKLYNRKMSYTEIPPSAIKKYYTGNGHSNKTSMAIQFEAENIIDLYEECNFPRRDYADIPNPIQDIVDATAIVYYLMKKIPKRINKIDSILTKMKMKEST